MVRTTRNRLFCTLACISMLMLISFGLAGCGKSKPEPGQSDEPNLPVDTPNEGSPLAGLTPAPVTPVEPTPTPYEPSQALQNIIAAAKTWDASFRPSWGKIAPDFTLTDVAGNVHTLSDYRGGNVLVVIWRTWNATCKLQIPHLKELRTMFPPESLAILTISDEPIETLREFAGQNSISYTVLSSGGNLPDLFGQVEYAPSNFFIGPEGKIKMAATGLIPTVDAAAIINAP